jgi:hypothetical protein
LVFAAVVGSTEGFAARIRVAMIRKSATLELRPVS